MASTIKLKNGSGAPLASDLVQGEPALDLTNKRLYTEDSLGAVIEVGTNPTEITTGTITASGDVAVDTDTLFVDVSADKVGINTSSPSTPLQVNGSSGQIIYAQADAGDAAVRVDSSNTGSNAYFWARATNTGNSRLQFGDPDDADVGWINYDHSTDSLDFRVNAAERLSIDSSGNVGIGTTPEPTWITGYAGRVLQIGDAAVFGGSTNDSMSYMLANAYYDSGNSRWEYINTDFATRYEQLDGEHVFYTAASGTADAAITWSEAMRIDSSGNVGIGTSSPSRIIHTSSSVPALRLEDSDVSGLYYELLGQSTGQFDLRIDEGNVQANSAFNIRIDGSDAMRIDSSGNVGINETDPDEKLHISNSSNVYAKIERTGQGYVLVAAESGTNSIYSRNSSNAAYPLRFMQGSTQAMTLDSSGNLLVGTTDSTPYDNSAGTSADTGIALRSDGLLSTARYNGILASFNRTGTDGDIIRVLKDGTTVGSIGVQSNQIEIDGNPSAVTTVRFGTTATIYPNTDAVGDLGAETRRFKDLYLSGGVYAEDYILAASGSTFSIYPKSGATSHNTFLYCQKSDGVNVGGGFDNGYAGAFRPSTDNAQDLGGSSHRWDDVYATNATIQTSDRNEKQDIEELSDAEQRVAVAAKGLLRKYRWINSVEEKGEDARIHFGIIAQDLEDAFTAEGLDAGRYAMFIHNEWWESEVTIPAVEEQTDEDGNVIVQAEPERTEIERYNSESDAPEGAVYKERRGIRYNQLLAFIIAAI